MVRPALANHGTAVPPILVDSDGAVATVAFNRPDRRNAIDLDAWRVLDAALGALATRDELRCLVLRGAGDGPFCAGHDLSRFAAERRTPAQVKAFSATVKGVADAIRDFPRPTVAMIRGHCMGAGVQIALNCDFRVAGDSARIALTPQKVGLYLEYELIDALVALVGVAAAQEVVLAGRVYGAGEARRIGLVNVAVGDDALETETAALAARLAGAEKTVARPALGRRPDL